jgi:polysaccharide export outer membrane protein
MKKHKVCIYILFSILFASCVPTKDLIYLQDKGKSKAEVVTPSNQKPYRLQTNDILNISVKAIDPKLVEIFNLNGSQGGQAISEQSSYFNGYSVDDHGNIRMPILDEINVLGYTTEEVRLKIEKELHENYFKTEAGIYVVVKLAGFRYTINGEINTTGTKVLYQDKVNIMEAIANAGDITITGDRKNVVVIRRYPQGSETFTIDLTDSKAVNSPCFYLQPNDVVYVEPNKAKIANSDGRQLRYLGIATSVLSIILVFLIRVI